MGPLSCTPPCRTLLFVCVENSLFFHFGGVNGTFWGDNFWGNEFHFSNPVLELQVSSLAMFCVSTYTTPKLTEGVSTHPIWMKKFLHNKVKKFQHGNAKSMNSFSLQNGPPKVLILLLGNQFIQPAFLYLAAFFTSSLFPAPGYLCPHGRILVPVKLPFRQLDGNTFCLRRKKG